MKYQTIEELEIIGRAGAIVLDENLGNRNIKRCRVLSSFWLCTNPGNDGIAEHLREDGYWESWVTQWISANVSPGSICIDAGATYGYYTFFLAQHGCRVYSIEANPDLIPLLECSNYLNGSWDRVTIINKAVADRSGQHVQLALSDTIGGTSIKTRGKGAIVDIESIALDELLQLETKIDFVKLDISSSEELAWWGMQQIMQSNPSCTCIMEFAPNYYSNRGKDFLNSILKEFSVSYINNDGQEIRLRDFSFFEQDDQNWRMLVIKNVHAVNKSNDIITTLYFLE